MPETAEPDNVVDIMDALKRSLQDAGADRRPRAASKKAADTREPARGGAQAGGPQDRGAQGGALRREAGLPLADPLLHGRPSSWSAACRA